MSMSGVICCEKTNNRSGGHFCWQSASGFDNVLVLHQRAECFGTLPIAIAGKTDQEATKDHF